jgi:short-subunit dehydrogenase
MAPLISPAAQAALGLSSIALGVAIGRRAIRPEYSFRGRTVVITGASRGLGLELARQLAAEGARLWLIARSPEALATTAEELRRHGAARFVETIAADLRFEEQIDRAVERIMRSGDAVDVLVNNAGTIEVGPFEHATIEDFADSIDTHFWAPLLLIRKLLPHIPRHGEGRIVNVSSIAGRFAVPHLAPYVAGKFALTGLSETLRAELAKSGIAVTTVTPGLMRTGSYVSVRLRGRHSDEFRWFAALLTTPLTSMQTSRAASQIITAVRRKRAVVTPGWQARAAQTIAAVAPGALDAVNAAVDRWLLPPPTGDGGGDQARLAATVDPGAVRHLLSRRRRREYHQPAPTWD